MGCAVSGVCKCFSSGLLLTPPHPPTPVHFIPKVSKQWNGNRLFYQMCGIHFQKRLTALDVMYLISNNINMEWYSNNAHLITSSLISAEKTFSILLHHKQQTVLLDTRQDKASDSVVCNTFTPLRQYYSTVESFSFGNLRSTVASVSSYSYFGCAEMVLFKSLLERFRVFPCDLSLARFPLSH